MLILALDVTVQVNWVDMNSMNAFNNTTSMDVASNKLGSSWNCND